NKQGVHDDDIPRIIKGSYIPFKTSNGLIYLREVCSLDEYQHRLFNEFGEKDNPVILRNEIEIDFNSLPLLPTDCIPRASNYYYIPEGYKYLVPVHIVSAHEKDNASISKKTPKRPRPISTINSSDKTISDTEQRDCNIADDMQTQLFSSVY